MFPRGKCVTRSKLRTTARPSPGHRDQKFSTDLFDLPPSIAAPGVLHGLSREAIFRGGKRAPKAMASLVRPQGTDPVSDHRCHQHRKYDESPAEPAEGPPGALAVKAIHSAPDYGNICAVGRRLAEWASPIWEVRGFFSSTYCDLEKDGGGGQNAAPSQRSRRAGGGHRAGRPITNNRVGHSRQSSLAIRIEMGGLDG